MNTGTIEEMIRDMERGVYDFTKDGHCSQCGQCCSNFLPMSQKEIKRIKYFLKKHPMKEQKHFLPTAKICEDMTCPFRSDSQRKCLIYDIRPAICRDFQCDKPRKQIEANKRLYHGRLEVVDLRREFFHA